MCGEKVGKGSHIKWTKVCGRVSLSEKFCMKSIIGENIVGRGLEERFMGGGGEKGGGRREEERCQRGGLVWTQ